MISFFFLYIVSIKLGNVSLITEEVSKTLIFYLFNPFMRYVEKWPNLHRKIFKLCLAIFQHYAWKG